MRVVFDTRELYFLTQYVPACRALVREGVDCSFLAYHNRPTIMEDMRRAFEADGLDVVWCETREDGLEWYRRERPDWVVFGNGYGLIDGLPEGTRTVQLYHGVGMKTDMFKASLMEMDVRYIEGPYYERIVREQYPDYPAEDLVPVGYAKLDPMLGPEDERPRIDLEAVGLDPGKKTLLYAPTHSPSSFPRMSDDWPADFADFNLLVKPHYLSYVSSSRKSHRAKMERWSRASNCYVASVREWNAIPFMATADLMISDVSSVLFEFAALDRPIVWCDFLDLHFFRRGLFRSRMSKRMHATAEVFADIAAHAARYKDLRALVLDQLEHPEAFSAQRRRYALELLGPLDGRASERIARDLVARGGSERVLAREASRA